MQGKDLGQESAIRIHGKKMRMTAQKSEFNFKEQ